MCQNKQAHKCLTYLCNFQVIPWPFHVNRKEWEDEVMNHTNENCRNTQLQIGLVDHLYQHLTDCGGGLTFDPDVVQCVPYKDMCQIGYSKNPTFDHTYYNCPPLMRILQSDFFCKNPANFNGTHFKNDTSCPSGQKHCKGDSPSKCHFGINCHIERACPDNSDYSCRYRVNDTIHEDYLIEFASCIEWGFICKDKQQCIHMDLLCDGYEQCEDKSDEADEYCGSCP